MIVNRLPAYRDRNNRQALLAKLQDANLDRARIAMVGVWERSARSDFPAAVGIVDPSSTSSWTRVFIPMFSMRIMPSRSTNEGRISSDVVDTDARAGANRGTGVVHRSALATSAAANRLTGL